jgi:CDP-diacylglycerol--glycerol-3-phosphate 3-phosphatidyltransferase
MATSTPPRPVAIVNLPNLLTSSRLVLSVVLFALIAFESWLWCLVVFCVAALTDWLDGYLARRQGLTSALGRVFDPLVDKVLVCGAFIFLMPHGTEPKDEAAWMTPWMVTVVVAREFIITGLRGWLESMGVRFGADWLGKIKMALQCTALVVIFVALAASGPTGADPAAWSLRLLRIVLVYAMLVATILSGLQYLLRGAVILRGNLLHHNPGASP